MSYAFIVVIFILALCLFHLLRLERTRRITFGYLIARLQAISQRNEESRVLVFTRDKQIKELLIAVNQILDRLSEEKAQYEKTKSSTRRMLANISHDLKTPLTVVMGYIETVRIRGTVSADEDQNALMKAYEKAQEMLVLLGQFFDLAKLEAGDWTLPLSRLSLNEVARKNILAFFDLLAMEGIELELEIPETEVYVLGNENALARIIENLVTNAIKYGKDGGNIGLAVRFDDLYAYLDVWDRGPGIPYPHQDRIFDRLYTLNDSRSRHLQGSGLGLAIVGGLVEKQGGSATLKCKPYEKTTFTCSFKRVLF